MTGFQLFVTGVTSWSYQKESSYYTHTDTDTFTLHVEIFWLTFQLGWHEQANHRGVT